MNFKKSVIYIPNYGSIIVQPVLNKPNNIKSAIIVSFEPFDAFKHFKYVSFIKTTDNQFYLKTIRYKCILEEIIIEEYFKIIDNEFIKSIQNKL